MAGNSSSGLDLVHSIVWGPKSGAGNLAGSYLQLSTYSGWTLPQRVTKRLQEVQVIHLQLAVRILCRPADFHDRRGPRNAFSKWMQMDREATVKRPPPAIVPHEETNHQGSECGRGNLQLYRQTTKGIEIDINLKHHVMSMSVSIIGNSISPHAEAIAGPCPAFET